MCFAYARIVLFISFQTKTYKPAPRRMPTFRPLGTIVEVILNSRRLIDSIRGKCDMKTYKISIEQFPRAYGALFLIYVKFYSRQITMCFEDKSSFAVGEKEAGRKKITNPLAKSGSFKKCKLRTEG